MDKNNKIKILITASTFPGYTEDTCPRFVLDFCKSLQSFDEIECLVLAPHCKGAKTKETMEGINVKRYKYFFPTDLEVLSGNGIMSVLKKNKLTLLIVPFFVFFQLISTLITIKQYKPDIIIANWILPQGLIAAIAKIFYPAIKIILVIRGADVSLISKNPIFKLIGKFIFSKTDKLISVSSSLLNIVQNNFNIKTKKPEVIPTGLNEKLFKTLGPKEAGQKNLLFIGRLVEKKGITYLIEAFTEALKTHPDIKLYIAGDGTLKQKLISLVKKLQINQSVVFYGAVKHSQVIELYYSSLMLIAPSIDTKDDIEGIPNVIKEAIASKIPVITTNAGGITDLVEDSYTGIIVEQKNSRQIAEKIIELIENETLRKHLTENAYNKLLADFTLDVTGEKYRNIIFRMTGKERKVEQTRAF